MTLIKTAVSGIKWTSVGTIGLSIFQILQISILTRYLSKEVFGLVAMALFTLNLTSIFANMGMTTAILHRQDATKNEYSSIYWLNIFISLFLYVILFIMAPVAAKFYNEPDLHVVIIILGVNLLLMAAGRQHRTIMQKQFQFKSIAITELFSYLCGLIAAIALAIQGFGVYSLVYSSLLSSGISNGLFLVQNLKLNPIGFHFKFSETKAFLKIGGYTTGSSLLDFFSREIDILIVGKTLGAESLGVYSLVKQIVMKVLTVINPIIMNVFSPLLSSIQNRKEQIKDVYLEVVKNLAFMNFLIYTLMIVNAKEILYVLYGSQYVEAYLVFVFLAVAYCLSALSNPTGSLQVATGRTDLGFKWTILRMIISPLAIYLGSQISIEAVAGYYGIVSLILILPLWYVQIKPMIDVSLWGYISKFYKPFIFFISITLLVIFIGNIVLAHSNQVVNALIKSVIITVLYIVYLLVVDRFAVIKSYNLLESILKPKR